MKTVKKQTNIDNACHLVRMVGVGLNAVKPSYTSCRFLWVPASFIPSGPVCYNS